MPALSQGRVRRRCWSPIRPFYRSMEACSRPTFTTMFLYDLLNKKGPPNSNDRQINIAGIGGSETENHILNITVGQYLTNQLMLADTQDNNYNNATNGMNTFMADFLHNLLTNDFLEYNARPYQDYAITAIQYLYSFAADANDAPSGGSIVSRRKARRTDGA